MPDTDTLQTDIDRVYGEYFAAREAYEAANPKDDGFVFVKRRFDQAMSNLHETRRAWREIGEAAGVRGAPVVTEDHAAPPPDLIGDAWTGRRHNPKKG